MRNLLALSALLAFATPCYGQVALPAASHIIPRFSFEYSGLVASGPARAGAVVTDEGGRATLEGRETGAFDVYVKGARIAHDFRLSFRWDGARDASEAVSLAQSVVIRPEGITFVYSHPTFTVREHAFVPLDEPGAVVVLEVATLRPLSIAVNGATTVGWRVDSASAATQFLAIAVARTDSQRARLATHAREYWQEKVAHFRRVRLDGVSLEAPDVRVGQTLEWAKVALARRPEAENIVAAIDFGEHELARTQLINADLSSNGRDLEWVRASYQYWLASGDESFLRAYWPSIVRAVKAAPPDTARAERLSALEALQELARALKDHDVLAYAAQQIANAQQQLADVSDSTLLSLARALSFGQLDVEPAERLLQRIAGSEFAADWGVRLLSRDYANYDPLRWDRGAVSAYASGVVALADYRYHRAWSGFDLVRDVARETFDFSRGRTPALLSGAYYQVLAAQPPAARMQQAAAYVDAVLQGLLGWEVDAPNHAATLEPHLPPEWNELTVHNLRSGRERLDIGITRGDGVYSISLHRLTSGAPLTLRVAPALPLGARVDRIVVDDAEVPAQSEETSHDVHAVAEVSLTSDAQIDVHYQGGIEPGTIPEHVEVGETSHELKVLDFRRDQRDYLVTVEGLPGSSYTLPLRTPWRVRAVSGADSFEQAADRVTVHVTFAGDAASSASKTLRVHFNP